MKKLDIINNMKISILNFIDVKFINISMRKMVKFFK